MWEESWPNLIMKMKDMPYYKYKPAKDRKKADKYEEFERGAKPGDTDVLMQKFNKYVQK
jgi:hypothetical protein